MSLQGSPIHLTSLAFLISVLVMASCSPVKKEPKSDKSDGGITPIQKPGEPLKGKINGDNFVAQQAWMLRDFRRGSNKDGLIPVVIFFIPERINSTQAAELCSSTAPNLDSVLKQERYLEFPLYWKGITSDPKPTFTPFQPIYLRWINSDGTPGERAWRRGGIEWLEWISDSRWLDGRMQFLVDGNNEAAGMFRIDVCPGIAIP